MSLDNPAISISLDGHGRFTSWVHWNDVCWDSWLWLDVFERPLGNSWVNDALLEECRVVHPTMESLWTADIFEPLLCWINDELSPATHIGLWGEIEQCTWAHLMRDGAPLGNATKDKDNKPAYLIPVHDHTAGSG